MKSYLKDERGTALVFELIVLAVVLAAAGFAVYQYLGHKNATNKSVPPKPHVGANASPAVSPHANIGYLAITEWGVELPATGRLANLKYQILNGSAMLYTSDLYPKYQLCGPSGGALGGLSRIASSADSGTVNAIKAGTINGYDYYFSEDPQPCVQGSAATKTDEQLNQDQQNALINEARQLTLLATPTTSPAAIAGYLTVTQWGVNIKMAEAAKAFYTYAGADGSDINGKYDSSISLWINPQYLQDKTCDPSVSMMRSKTMPAYAKTTKVGDYYYFVDGSPYHCSVTADDAINSSLVTSFMPENVTGD
jgi:hypothetical protein